MESSKNIPVESVQMEGRGSGVTLQKNRNLQRLLAAYTADTGVKKLVNYSALPPTTEQLIIA
jgi:hypothetical protein